MPSTTKTDRRHVLRAGLNGIAGVAAWPLLGLAGTPRRAAAQVAGRSAAGTAEVTTEALGDRVTLIRGVPGNVVALSTGQGLVLVDSGAANSTTVLQATLEDALGAMPVRALFNTHYHADQTGGNADFAEAGAAIRAHEITRQWLSADYYVPAEDRWVEAPPIGARPTETFRLRQAWTVDGDRVEAGYLLEAHTRGDIYVFFRDANVLAVGDVASPERDPVHDWYAGGWLGGRVDALDDLLEIANDETRIVPAYGPVMTRAELEAERDMMSQLYERTSTLVNAGRSAEDLLAAGVLDDVEREFDDPYRFLYDVAKGLWAHYLNFGGNVV
ncbi:MAG: MBL fold metallo-hydrolase [Gammaproteobacteria bacterium]|nr:MBL fold metallo-hydrolase [Gammaproteobacteria bacterium]